MNANQYDVIIAGAGPVGLFLGLCLDRLGLSFVILEKRRIPSKHSRSIGLHPPSLELFDKINLSNQLIEQGICIKKGHAFQDHHTKLGTLDFSLCPKPHQYILSLPQNLTEAIMEKALPGEHPVIRDAEITGFDQDDDGMEVCFKDSHNQPSRMTASYLVGCDGKNSIVREKANIVFHGKTYPYHYAMGDFDDHTDFCNQAIIYLSQEGLVESFPLPDNKRRWVAELPVGFDGNLDTFVHILAFRTGHKPDIKSNSMFSAFTAEHYQAAGMHSGRVFLAGDSAHLLSPIGGQGMNLGWMDAWQLAHALKDANLTSNNDRDIFKVWEKHRTRCSQQAVKRAEFNMTLGQKNDYPRLRNIAVKNLLRFPFNRLLVKRFTMRGLS